jgi:hypothetical protein
MDIGKMTRKDFEALPLRKWDEETTCASVILLPYRTIHESGYRRMGFVAVGKDNIPICRISGGSDVVHVDGIGGYGKAWRDACITLPRLIPPSGWSIDCLPKSGLLRLWPSSGTMVCGAALSSFEIFALVKEE